VDRQARADRAEAVESAASRIAPCRSSSLADAHCQKVGTSFALKGGLSIRAIEPALKLLSAQVLSTQQRQFLEVLPSQGLSIGLVLVGKTLEYRGKPFPSLGIIAACLP